MQNASTSPRSATLVRSLGRAVVAVAALLVVVKAEAGIKSERLLSAILANTPAAVIVAHGQQMKEAEKAAAAIPGAETLWGVGSSMEPLYASSTAVIVAPVKFDELKKGMTVVYMNSRGRMVAHSLTGDMPKGWIAQGVNNDKADSDLVTKSNLIGVIVKAYSSEDSDFRVELTKRLASKDRSAVVASRT